MFYLILSAHEIASIKGYSGYNSIKQAKNLISYKINLSDL